MSYFNVINGSFTMFQTSKLLYDMDSVKAGLEAETNYPLTQDEWAGVKSNFCFFEVSKEYAIGALRQLIQFITDEPQESNLFSTSVVSNVARGGRFNKGEILEDLRLLEHCLPNWYKMPPSLANTYKSHLYNLFRIRICDSLRALYQQQLNAIPPAGRYYEWQEHPYKWFEVVNHFVNQQLEYDDYEEEGMFYFFFDEEPTLRLSVKQFCYLNGNSRKFLCRNFEENPIGEDDDWEDRLAYNVKTDDEELDPNAPLFDTEKTQRGLDALAEMIPKTSLSGVYIDPFFQRFEEVGKLRWLLQATQRNLTFNEKEYVFFYTVGVALPVLVAD